MLIVHEYLTFHLVINVHSCGNAASPGLTRNYRAHHCVRYRLTLLCISSLLSRTLDLLLDFVIFRIPLLYRTSDFISKLIHAWNLKERGRRFILLCFDMLDSIDNPAARMQRKSAPMYEPLLDWRIYMHETSYNN